MPETLRDCYRLLDLEPGASPAAVKAAYRAMVKVWHPDRFPGDEALQARAQEKLRQINLAYERLSKLPEPAGGANDWVADHLDERPPANPGRPRYSGQARPQASFYEMPNPRAVKLGCLFFGLVGVLMLVFLISSMKQPRVDSGYYTDLMSPPRPPRAPQESTNEVDAEAATGAVEKLPEMAPTVPLEDLELNAPRMVADVGAPTTGSKTLELELAMRRAEAKALGAAESGLVERARRDGVSLQEAIRSSANDADETLPQVAGTTNAAPVESTPAEAGTHGGLDFDLRAAREGNVDSQFNLAIRYGKGLGVEANPVEALKWCLIAGANGHALAARSQATFGQGMETSDKDEAWKRARQFISSQKK